MSRVLLDLFCKAGGAGKGYHDAGFEVVGVDIELQPNYPYEFHQADSMTYPLDGFDVIHASPPCQAYTMLQREVGPFPDLYFEEYVPIDLYAAIRDRLIKNGKPWIVENVVGAPYDKGIILCGSMFGLAVRRHRNFEMSVSLLAPSCRHDLQPAPILVSGRSGGNTLRHRKGVMKDWPKYMGMPWATPAECTQAIPPAYTQYIGELLYV